MLLELCLFLEGLPAIHAVKRLRVDLLVFLQILQAAEVSATRSTGVCVFRGTTDVELVLLEIIVPCEFLPALSTTVRRLAVHSLHMLVPPAHAHKLLPTVRAIEVFESGVNAFVLAEVTGQAEMFAAFRTLVRFLAGVN